MSTLVDTNKPQNPHPLPYFVFFFFFFCKSRGKHSGWFDAGQRSGGMAARPGLHHSSEAAGGLFNARCQSSSMRRNWPRPIFTVSQSSISSIKPNKQTSYFMRWGTPALPSFWNRAVGVWEQCGPRICVDRPTWCFVRPVSAFRLWMCALDWPFIFIFRGWAPGCGKRQACTESRLAQNFFSADQNRAAVHLCTTSTAWN